MSEIIGNQTLPEGQEEPKIEFPCDYPIKILGEAEESFNALVASIVLKHAPDFDVSTVTSRDSSKGKFRSVGVIIRATGEPQIMALFEELKATGRVKMVI